MGHISVVEMEKFSDVAIVSIDESYDNSDIFYKSVLSEVLLCYKNGTKYYILDIRKLKSISTWFLDIIVDIRKEVISNFDSDIVILSTNEQKIYDFHDSSIIKTIFIFTDKENAISYFYWEYKGNCDTISLVFSPNFNYVVSSRKFIRGMVENRNYSSKEVYHIETIIDELCNNAIEHSDANNSIELVVSIGVDKIEINVLNYVENSNIDNRNIILNKMKSFKENPSSDAVDLRGRGLYIVEKLSDEIDIDASEDGTCVHVVKYRKDIK